jgi:hypothetical protein
MQHPRHDLTSEAYFARARANALRSRLAGERMLAAFDRFIALVRKAGFNPDQPRQPGPGPGAGQWMYVEGYAQGRQPGIGHNGGPPLTDPPEIPKQDPGDKASRLAKAKAVAKWLAMFGARRIPQVAAALAAIEAADWLRTELPSIRTYRDAPKTYDELVNGAREPRPGYHKHHVVEQQSANDGIPRSMIDGIDNIVSVPIYRHRQITGWYQTPIPEFGGLSPRDYLRGKDWSEHVRVGRYALERFGVLKP